jgi:hypothetical protein
MHGHRPLVADCAERDKLERAMETLFADTAAIASSFRRLSAASNVRRAVIARASRLRMSSGLRELSCARQQVGSPQVATAL